MVHSDDDDDETAVASARPDHTKIVWWPAWLFDNYHELSSMCSRMGLSGNHFQEYLEASKCDPGILARKVAYLIGDQIPYGHHRTVYNPRTKPMSMANNEIVERGTHLPGWLQACADGSKRSDFVTSKKSNTTPITKAATTTKRANFTNQSRTSSLEPIAKKSKSGGTDKRRGTINKPRTKNGQRKRTGSSKRRDEATKTRTSCASLASQEDEADKKRTSNSSLSSQSLTARQRKMKIMVSDSESDDEKYFYAAIWKNVLQFEGWTYVKAKGLDDWWYFLPGHSANNGVLGIDFFKNIEDVIQYCKDKNYYAKYGNMMTESGKHETTSIASPPTGHNQQQQPEELHYHNGNPTAAKTKFIDSSISIQPPEGSNQEKDELQDKIETQEVVAHSMVVSDIEETPVEAAAAVRSIREPVDSNGLFGKKVSKSLDHVVQFYKDKSSAKYSNRTERDKIEANGIKSLPTGANWQRSCLGLELSKLLRTC